MCEVCEVCFVCSSYLQQKRALRIVADFHRLPCYLINRPTDILSRSLKLLKLPDLARYFTCILGFRIFLGNSPEFIFASFDEAEHRFCFRDRFNQHTLKKTSRIISLNNFQQSSVWIKVTCIFYHFQIITIQLHQLIIVCSLYLFFCIVCFPVSTRK